MGGHVTTAALLIEKKAFIGYINKVCYNKVRYTYIT
jgi:hypothetical protein